MKQLTEAQAWREIARRLGQGKWFRFGPCHEADRLWCERRCSDETQDIMEKRVTNHVSPGDSVYVFAYVQGEERDARILAALWMALEAEAGLEP